MMGQCLLKNSGSDWDFLLPMLIWIPIRNAISLWLNRIIKMFQTRVHSCGINYKQDILSIQVFSMHNFLLIVDDISYPRI